MLISWTIEDKKQHLLAQKVRMFVLDEADVMIGIQGHQDQSIRFCWQTNMNTSESLPEKYCTINNAKNQREIILRLFQGLILSKYYSGGGGGGRPGKMRNEVLWEEIKKKGA